MFARLCRRKASRERGFTLTELVVVIAILGVIIVLAVPRYMAARKKAYKAEADNALQQTKALEWAYYQLFASFDTSAAGLSLGLTLPNNLHWNNPSISGNGNLITITMSGKVSPLKTTDSDWITLSVDGTSTSGATF